MEKRNRRSSGSAAPASATTARSFPGAAQFSDEIRAQGFVDVGHERLSFGIVAIHTARKPLVAGA